MSGAILKRDGHTHSQFCLHGSGEDTESFILKAIKEGFAIYSITEHAPLPPDFVEALPYPANLKRSIQLAENELDSYIPTVEKLKHKYRDSLQILTGFEIDYLPGCETYTRAFLRDYGPFLDDALLSVHFTVGAGGWRCMDESPQDFGEGLLDFYGSYEKVQLQYYQTVKQALTADLGKYKPRRISHLTLCNKFQRHFKQTGKVSEAVKKEIVEILQTIKKQGYSLDFNVSGLFKPYCGEIYPTPWIAHLARGYGIPLVYGSDAHSVDQVGRAYSEYEKIIK